MPSFFVLFGLLSALVFYASALPSGTRTYGIHSENAPFTNAERLQRGLPLKPPVRRTTLPGTHHSPSASASPSPSPSPSSSVRAGYVAVFSGDARIGYLQCSETCKVIPNDESYYATAVTFTLNPRGLPFDIMYDGASSPNIGGLVDAFSGDLGTRSTAEARLQSVPTTKPGDLPPSSVAEFSESAIWTYAPLNGLLVPTWINSFNDDVTTFIMADDKGNLFLSGDVSEFRVKHGTQSSGPLTFHFTNASAAARARASY
ncbi:hypothetical protein DACRYDRAFT_116131 [Dacryopinax primogenitus]|uniref:Acid protease n=1 Tax=Dacryopinax primogenitus (strain DJM 731) TaxID=1858805 RepID=M5GDJ1_DACPD|nr:uncharacterized protein DACRYDRAFT_116131 [Dacryopinax primogenitus]EJU02448.1 hypothetical protein DACRYDRAFT_116131 [Dacryopinax primogenitus]